MSKKTDWQERYSAGDLPWNIGGHDFNLAETVSKWRIKPCRFLEAGCGTGGNAIWFARQGFPVTAVDISEIAVKRAIEKASGTGVQLLLPCRPLS